MRSIATVLSVTTMLGLAAASTAAAAPDPLPCPTYRPAADPAATVARAKLSFIGEVTRVDHMGYPCPGSFYDPRRLCGKQWAYLLRLRGVWKGAVDAGVWSETGAPARSIWVTSIPGAETCADPLAAKVGERWIVAGDMMPFNVMSSDDVDGLVSATVARATPATTAAVTRALGAAQPR